METKVLATDGDIRKETETWLSTFPELNPNPILEVSLDGRIFYANQTARGLFSTLEQENTNHAFLIGWEAIREQLLAQPDLNLLREVQVGEQVYQQSIYFIKEYQRFRVYGMDVSERKLLVQELQLAKEKLEIQAQDLELQNEELRSQSEELFVQTDELHSAIHQLNEKERLSKAFIHISDEIHSSVHFDEIMQQAITEAAQALECDSAAVSFLKKGHWIINYAYGFPTDVIGMQMNNKQERHAVLAISTKKPVAITDAYNDHRFNTVHFKKWGIRSVLVIPILVHGEALGVFYFNYQRSTYDLKEMHIEFGLKLTSTISLALENAGLIERLEAEIEERKRIEEIFKQHNIDLEAAHTQLRTQTKLKLEHLAMLENAHILVRDLEDKIIFWNRGAEDLYQFKSEAALGKVSHLFLRTEFPMPLEQIQAELMQTGKWEGELKHHKKDGSEVYVASHWSLYRDSENQPRAIIEVNNDITAQKILERQLEETNAYLDLRVNIRTQELKEANAELHSSYEELQTAMEELEAAEEELRVHNDELAESSQRAIVLAEVSQLLIETGPEFLGTMQLVVKKISEKIGGTCVMRLVSKDQAWLDPIAHYDPDPTVFQILSHSLKSNAHPADRYLDGEVFRERAGKIFQINSPEKWEGRISVEAAPYIDKFLASSVLIVPLRLKNQAIGTLSLARRQTEGPYTEYDLLFLQELADRVAMTISNARLYQELEKAYLKEKQVRNQLIQSEKYTALARLVASVAHEINNPLQTIQNCLYLLGPDVPEGPSQETIGMAITEGKRISGLVGQLRETYQPLKEYHEVNIELLDLLNNIHQLIEPQLKQNNVAWRLETEQERVTLQGVPDQLKQVFLNICLNAVDAMGSKGGELVVSVKQPASGDKIWIEFRDTGPGIEPRYINQIFEPFFTTKEKGTGLGLSICYEIVKDHGGEITVESKPGHGATFKVGLPKKG